MKRFCWRFASIFQAYNNIALYDLTGYIDGANNFAIVKLFVDRRLQWDAAQTTDCNEQDKLQTNAFHNLMEEILLGFKNKVESNWESKHKREQSWQIQPLSSRAQISTCTRWTNLIGWSDIVGVFDVGQDWRKRLYISVLHCVLCVQLFLEGICNGDMQGDISLTNRGVSNVFWEDLLE